MKILVVSATPNELKSIKEWIKSANLKENLNIDFLCCWIWNYNAISSLEHYLTQNPEPIFIRNIWICGYRNSINELKAEPIQIANIINIHTKKEFIIPPFLEIAPLKTCFCSENIILEKPKLKKGIWTKNDEKYFDMESRWIEFISSKYKFPRVLLKIPYDFIGQEKAVNEKNYKEISENIDKILKNLTYHDYLEKILKWIKQQK